MKKIALILMVVGVFVLWGERAFAVTYFHNPSINNEQIAAEYPKELISETEPTPLQDTAHAPEPASFILFLSGITGFLVRFINKSFEKFKRLSDIVLSLIGLTFAMPILGFAAILIKLNSRGPVVYKQNRVGEGGKVFQIYKLRTMDIDAEKGTGAVWSVRNDPRVTTVGKVLRKTHIDEIPQLFNVIIGDMSIVGPRPERPELVRDFKKKICDYEKRLTIKPGITGVAQVWHKYDESLRDVKKKIKYDLLYTKKMGLWLDLRVLAQTAVVVATGKNQDL
jgi:lipopolysaccharide/colanic/teichoic acid biosynthesis glycosyltransferase